MKVKKLLAIFLILLILSMTLFLGVCSGASDGETNTNIPLTIAELAEGTYVGTLSGDSYGNSSATITTTFSPADIEVTIGNGEITLYAAAIGIAEGMFNGVATPQSPEFTNILSGSLPLQVSGDALIAEGEVSMLGETIQLNYANNAFTNWTVSEHEAGKFYSCTVRIAMENGVPVATITATRKQFERTAIVPLALKEESGNGLLSAPYAEMLKSGNYQYTYPLTHEGIDFIVTIAAKDGMACRKVVSADGTFQQRVLSRDDMAYQIDDMTGTVQELGAEAYETPPDYAGTLIFVSDRTLETGAVAEAYKFEHTGTPSYVIFVFSEGKLVEFVTTIKDVTSETFVSDMTGTPDLTLFEIPQ